MEFREYTSNIEASLRLSESIHQFRHFCLVEKWDAPLKAAARSPPKIVKSCLFKLRSNLDLGCCC